MANRFEAQAAEPSETRSRLKRCNILEGKLLEAEDGETDLMIYHSRDYKTLRGTPLTDPNRHARARVIYWDAEGFPVFFSDKTD